MNQSDSEDEIDYNDDEDDYDNEKINIENKDKKLFYKYFYNKKITNIFEKPDFFMSLPFLDDELLTKFV